MTSSPNVHAVRAGMLDESAIAAEIALQLGRRPARMKQFPTKKPRYVYEASFTDGTSAIFKAEHDTDGEDAIVLECWAMDRAREAGVPTPRVLALDTTCSSFPGRYAIFERVAGEAVSACDLSAPARVLAEAGRLLRRLHDVRVRGYGHLDDEHYLTSGEIRGGLSTWRSFALAPALDAIAYARARDLFGGADLARMESLFLSNDDLFPERLDARLLHGDFDATHIFIDPRGLVITGIIDFGDRASGHPAWDLAGMALWDGIENLQLLLRGYATDDAERALLLQRSLIYLLAQMLRLAHRRHATGRPDDSMAVLEQARSALDVIGQR